MLDGVKFPIRILTRCRGCRCVVSVISCGFAIRHKDLDGEVIFYVWCLHLLAKNSLDRCLHLYPKKSCTLATSICLAHGKPCPTDFLDRLEHGCLNKLYYYQLSYWFFNLTTCFSSTSILLINSLNTGANLSTS